MPLPVKVDLSPPSTPAITGISAKRYKQSKVPRAGNIHCSAIDPTSGVDDCTVTGFTRRSGTHTLHALATNDAGLTSTSTLTYKVTAQCIVPRLTGKTLSAAKRALARAHCRLGTTQPARPSRAQRVSRSTPKAGAVKRAGTKVKLTFA